MTTKQFITKFRKFRKTGTGKKIETALWQGAVMGLQIAIFAGGEFDIRFLLATTPALLLATKFINNKYLK